MLKLSFAGHEVKTKAMKKILLLFRCTPVVVFLLSHPLQAFITDFGTEADFTNNFNSYGSTDGLSWNSGGFIRQSDGTTSNSASVLVPGGHQEVFALDNLKLSMDFRFNGLSSPSVGFYFGVQGEATPNNGLFALFTGTTNSVRYRFFEAGDPSTSSAGTTRSDTIVSTGGTGQPANFVAGTWYNLQLATSIMNDNQISATLSWYGYDSSSLVLLHELSYTYTVTQSAAYLDGGQVGLRMIRPQSNTTDVGSFAAIPEVRHAGVIVGLIVVGLAIGLRRARRAVIAQ